MIGRMPRPCCLATGIISPKILSPSFFDRNLQVWFFELLSSRILLLFFPCLLFCNPYTCHSHVYSSISFSTYVFPFDLMLTQNPHSMCRIFLSFFFFCDVIFLQPFLLIVTVSAVVCHSSQMCAKLNLLDYGHGEPNKLELPVDVDFEMIPAACLHTFEKKHNALSAESKLVSLEK